MNDKNFVRKRYKKYGNDSLGEYFKISHLEAYQGVSISNLNFTNRVHNQLKENNCTNLAELLSYTVLGLHNLKNVGRGSVGNIIEVVEKFVKENEKKYFYEKDFFLDKNDVDKNLQKTAIKKNPFVDSVIEMLDKFSCHIEKKYKLIYILSEKIKTLPKYFHNSDVSRLFYNYAFLCGEKNFEHIPENLKISDFPDYIQTYYENFNPKILENFIFWINFDIKHVAELLVAPVYEQRKATDKTTTVILERTKGKTLEEIGKTFGITRERVRQIENRMVLRFQDCCDRDKFKILLLLQFLTGGKSVLMPEDLEFFVGNETASVIWFLLSKIDLQKDFVHYDKDKMTVTFLQKNDAADVDEYKLIEDLPDMIPTEVFEDKIKVLARENNYPYELFLIKVMRCYKHNGKFVLKNRVTQTYKSKYVLKMVFKNGFKIADESDYKKFVDGYKYYFGENFTTSSKTLDAAISVIGFLCDRGKYKHPDYIKIPTEIINQVLDFIEKSPREIFIFKELYKIFSDKLKGTEITNSYLLQGALKFSRPPYTFRRDYLSKNKSTNIAEEFKKYMEVHKKVTAQEIKNAFVSFSDVNIALMLPRCRDVLSAGDGVFFHSSLLNISEKDSAEIENYIREIYTSIPIATKYLFNIFQKKFPDFMAKNEIKTPYKLFGILKYMFDDKFYFSRPYISLENIKKISNKSVVLRRFENIDKIKISELIKSCEDNGINYVSHSSISEHLRPEFIRVDKQNLMRTESLNITDEFISQTIKIVKETVKKNGGWIPANKFNNYENLPQLKIEWSDFLLDSIVFLSGDSIPTIKLLTSASEVSPTIFLSEKFAEDDYNSFVIKILIEEQSKKNFSDEKDLLQWMQKKGLCYRSLPGFLRLENHLSFDCEGDFIVE